MTTGPSLSRHGTTAEDDTTPDCWITGRTQGEGVQPQARRTQQVRAAGRKRLLFDHMNMEQIHAALARDFFLDLSAGFLYSCLDWKIRQLNGTAYRAWTLAHFGGTLCIDERHPGKYALLLATDPLGHFPAAFALVRAFDQERMERFPRQLLRHGFRPKVVSTDGSNLCPAVLAALWPHAQRQRCILHVLKDSNRNVLDAPRDLRRQLHRRGAQGRRRGRGRPRQGQRRRRGLTWKDKAHFIVKQRFVIVIRRGHLGWAGRGQLRTMFDYLGRVADAGHFR